MTAFPAPLTPTARIELVGPKEAQAFLAINTRNRQPSEHKIKSLVGKMTRGEWLLTGQAHVIVGWDGVLLNGQHTCSAVERSGVSIVTVVVRGIDPAAFSKIDIGWNRTSAQVFGMHGEENRSALGSVIRLVEQVQQVMSGLSIGSNAKDPDVILAAFSVNPDGFRSAANTAERVRRTARHEGLMVKSAALGAFIYLATDAGYELSDVERFCLRVVATEGHADGLPTTAMRRYLARSASNVTLTGRVSDCSAWIKSWNATVKSESMQLIRSWTGASSQFPTIEVAE